MICPFLLRKIVIFKKKKNMKYNIFLIMIIILVSCKKTDKSKCIDCDLIREFKINTLLPQKFGQDTVFIYDIISTNYCTNETKQYFFESNNFYNKKINECLKIKCITDSKGTQKCEIE